MRVEIRKTSLKSQSCSLVLAHGAKLTPSELSCLISDLINYQPYPSLEVKFGKEADSVILL